MPPSDDPFVAPGADRDLYHLLWELVHVFFEHGGRSRARGAHDAGASSFLYPFLAEQETDLEAVIADVRASVLMKAEEIGALRAQTLTEGARRAARGGGRAARRFDAGGTLLALGNGGSATDAMDVVADFRSRRRPAARSTSPRTRRSSPRSPTTSAPTRSSRAR